MRTTPWTACVGLCALVTGLGGCLSNTYEVPRDELQRLISLPGDQRGGNVHAVQRFGTAEDPPPAPRWSGQGSPYGMQQGVAPGVYMGPYFYPYGAPYHHPVVVDYGYEAQGSSSYEPTGAPSVPGSGQAHAAAGRSDAKEAIAAVVAVAVVVGVSLAVTEGARYDGAVAVHPKHPVHLMGPGYQHEVVALDELGPQHLRDDWDAVITGGEGAGLWRRGRRPLDREGMTYQMGFGSAAASLPDATEVGGGMGELQVGYFPNQYTGLLMTGAYSSGIARGGDYLSWRVGLEGKWYPIEILRLHVGGYGGFGQEWLMAGSGLPETDTTRPYVGYGGLLEFDLTTRLSLTLKVGAQWLPTLDLQDRTTPTLAFGLAVY